MTPPIALLIVMATTGMDKKPQFTNPWNGFLFGYVSDTLADELRVFATLGLVTILFNELFV
jgi:hypothetical protein